MARIEWEQIPTAIRAAASQAIGAPIVRAVSQPGGFSPGLAAVCTLGNGDHVFIKAVSDKQNPISPAMHRAEAQVMSRFPEKISAPRLLHHFELDGWVVLVLEALDASNPVTPWRAVDLDRVVAALAHLHNSTDPSPVKGLPTIQDALAGSFTGCRKLAEHGVGDGRHPIGDLDPWFVANVEGLADVETDWAEGAKGAALIHLDLRSDNVMIDRSGEVWFVDWAHATVGAAFTDLAGMAPSIAMEGGPSCEALWNASPWAATDPTAVTAFVAGLAGYFTWGARQPAPPGLPTLRPFMEAQGVEARRWIKTRLG